MITERQLAQAGLYRMLIAQGASTRQATLAASQFGAVGIVLDRQGQPINCLSCGDGGVGNWWEDFGDAVGNAFESGWDSLKDSFEKLGDWDSWGDIKDNIMTIVNPVGELGAAAEAAAYSLLFEMLGKYVRDLGEWLGSNYAEGESWLRTHIKNFVKDQLNGNSDFQNVMAEIVAQLYKLCLGYPTCVCEQGCIKPVADALADNGCPIVKIIGQILSVIWPVVQGTGDYGKEIGASHSISLYFYAGENKGSALPGETGAGSGEQLLPNLKLDQYLEDWLASVIEVVGDISFSTPQAMERFGPYLTDLVARGYVGPTAIGYRRESAKWFMYHPKTAAHTLKQANIVNDALGNIKKYIEWMNYAIEAYGYVEDAISFCQNSVSKISAEDVGEFFETVIQWAFDSDNWRKMGDWALDKGHEFVSSIDGQAVKGYLYKEGLGALIDPEGTYKEGASIYSKMANMAEAMTSGELKKLIEETTKSITKDNMSQLMTEIARLTKLYAEALNDERAAAAANVKVTNSKLSKVSGIGNIAGWDEGSVTSPLLTWMPAQIGLTARARYNDMVGMWIQMSASERGRWKNPPGGNEASWKSKKIDFPEWHKHLSGNKKVAEYEFNVTASGKLAQLIETSSSVWSKLSEADRDLWRAGLSVPESVDKGIRSLTGVSLWSPMIPNDASPPSARHLGWPSGAPKISGTKVSIEVYLAWVQDWLDIYAPSRNEAVSQRYVAQWGKLSSVDKQKWIIDSPRANNYIVAKVVRNSGGQWMVDRDGGIDFVGAVYKGSVGVKGIGAVSTIVPNAKVLQAVAAAQKSLAPALKILAEERIGIRLVTRKMYWGKRIAQAESIGKTFAKTFAAAKATQGAIMSVGQKVFQVQQYMNESKNVSPPVMAASAPVKNQFAKMSGRNGAMLLGIGGLTILGIALIDKKKG